MTTVRTTYLPQVTFTAQQIAPREVLNRVAQDVAETQLTVAAENAALRVIYGRQMIAPQVVQVLAHAGRLVILARWGKAPIDAIEALYLDNTALPGSVAVSHHLGGAHSPDAALVAAWAAQSPPQTYADAPAGTAYSVFAVPPGLSAGFPNITARIRGRKLYDDRSGLTVWSDNPALMLADFLRDTSGYGMGLTVDSASVIAAANACDELVSGEKRRTAGLVLDEPQEARDVVEALRTYAGCMVVRDGTYAKLVPDRPVATAGSLDSAAGQIVALRSLRKRGWRNVPTVVEVDYTDTNSVPWRTLRVAAKAPGVDAGTTDWRGSTVSLPGVQRRGQALREATERLNKLRLQDLLAEVEAFDDALKYEVGDVIEITHPVGLASKKMRVVAKRRAGSRPVFTLEEYQETAYSNAVAAEPVWVDTVLPTPANPPQVTGLTLTEVGEQQADGTWLTRIRAAWVAPDFPFAHHYQVTVRQGAAVIASFTARTTEIRTPPLAEFLAYQVDVETVSAVAASAAASASLTLDGKGVPPSDVPAWVTALEAGGVVYFAWGAVPDRDIAFYELRYGGLAGDFDSATIYAQVADIRKTVTGLAAGAYRFYLVAVDRSGNRSQVPLTRDITVTLDPSLLITEHAYTAPTLASLTFFRADRTQPGAWITDFGDGIGYGHADTNNATGTFADLAATAFAHPHTAGTSQWESESWDLGSEITGAWSIDADVIDLSGSRSVTLRLSPDGSVWTDHAWSGAPVSATGRYARARIATTGTMQVAEGVSAAVTVAARRDPNAGIVTTSASGPTTVTLAGEYVRAKSILVSPEGTAARMVTWDNVVLGIGASNSFDIYAFNDAGVQVAADVSWSFEGI